MIDDQELDEDLDEQEDTSSAAADLEELDDVDDVDDDAPTENKWDARRSLSEMLEDEEGEADKAKPAKPSAARKPAAPTGDAEELEGDDVDEEDLDDDDDEDEELEQESKSEQAKKGEAAKETPKPRYAVKGADGKTFEFELDKGTSIQFKADGRDVEVKSMDELVQLAQKGAAFDRKTSEQGQQLQRLATRETELQQNLETIRKTAEETLLAALFDREKRQALRKALAPYRDPEFRSGVEAKQQLAEQQEQTKASQQADVETKRTEFWQGVGAEIRKELDQTEHLTEDDAIEVATRFHNGYTRAFEAKFAELRAAGVAEAKANADANAHAFTYFNEKNLRRVVRGLNAELAEERKSVAKTKGAKTRTGKPDARAATAEADAHNNKLDKTLERRRRTPRLQGGGAMPGGSARGTPRDAPAKPRTFEQRMNSAVSLLRKGGDD